MKSFIFCTSFFENEEHYESRVLRWVNYYKNLEFSKDKPLVIIDDGSPDTSFCSKEFNIIDAENLPDKLEEVNLITFPTHLGRISHLAYIGWWRSFLFSFEVAKKYGFKKIIHSESDCYLLTDTITNYIENFDEGWLVFWSQKYNFAETCIQVMTEHVFSEHEKIKEKVEQEKRKRTGYIANKKGWSTNNFFILVSIKLYSGF